MEKYILDGVLRNTKVLHLLLVGIKEHNDMMGRFVIDYIMNNTPPSLIGDLLKDLMSSSYGGIPSAFDNWHQSSKNVSANDSFYYSDGYKGYCEFLKKLHLKFNIDTILLSGSKKDYRGTLLHILCHKVNLSDYDSSKGKANLIITLVKDLRVCSIYQEDSEGKRPFDILMDYKAKTAEKFEKLMEDKQKANCWEDLTELLDYNSNNIINV